MKDYLLYFEEIVLFEDYSVIKYVTKIIDKYHSEKRNEKLDFYSQLLLRKKFIKLFHQIRKKTLNLKSKKKIKSYISYIDEALNLIYDKIKITTIELENYAQDEIKYPKSEYGLVLNVFEEEFEHLFFKLQGIKRIFQQTNKIKFQSLKDGIIDYYYSSALETIKKKSLANSGTEELNFIDISPQDKLSYTSTLLNFFNLELSKREKYTLKELNQDYDTGEFIREIFSDIEYVSNKYKKKLKVDIQEKETLKNAYKLFRKYHKDMIELTKSVFNNQLSHLFQEKTIDEILKDDFFQKKNLKNDFVWKKKTSDLVELIYALYQTDAIGKIEGGKIKEKELVNFFSQILNISLDNFDVILSQAKSRKKDNTKFLNELIQNYLRSLLKGKWSG